MLESILNLIKGHKEKKEEELRQERLLRLEEYKLQEHGVQRTVAITETKDLAEEENESAVSCDWCKASGYLSKDIRMIYPCKECNATGQIYWIDRMLTAKRLDDYNDAHLRCVINNLHTLIHEIKQEAMKIGAIASVKIEVPENTAVQAQLKYANAFGGVERE
jgi:hypothetical protein